MSFREKIAWLTLVTMVVAYGVYFGILGPAARFGRSSLFDIIWTFGAVVTTQAIVVIIGSIVLAVNARGEARAPADERDRAIARRSASIAYYVLLVGVVVVGMVMPFSDPPWKIINAALAAVVVAELVRNAVVLLSYRGRWYA